MPVIKTIPGEADGAEKVAILARPDEAESHWQPVPANGYVELRVSSDVHQSVAGIDHGIQVIAPDSFVREHVHPDHDELLFFYEGEGKTVVEDEDHPVVVGTSLYVSSGVRHKFVNTSTTQPLKFTWTLLPGGLSGFFRGIGRPRSTDEAAPGPFARPDDVEQIERDTVFGKVNKD